MRSTSINRRLAAAIGLLLVMLVGVPAAASGAIDTAQPPPVDTDAVDSFVRSQMDKHRVPGLALGLVENGEITHLAGFGDAGNGLPVTPDTPFVLGSISKSFTAVAVLQLAEQGRIDLDATVRTYLPDFAVADLDATSTMEGEVVEGGTKNRRRNAERSEMHGP